MTKNILGCLISGCTWRVNSRTFYQHTALSPAHHSMTLTFLLKGGMRVRLNNTAFNAGRGDVVLLQPGDKYGFEPLDSRPLSYCVIAIAPVNTEGLVLTREKLGLQWLHRVRQPAKMVRLCKALHDAYKSKARYRLHACSMLGLRILLLLEPVQGLDEIPLVAPGNRPSVDRILEILDYINGHYKDRLAVSFLARRAGMHPSRFTRVFKSVTGIAPRLYVVEKKVLKAKDFLLLEKVSLSLTAEELGFHDYSHFYKVFRKITGISPKQFLRDNAVSARSAKVT